MPIVSSVSARWILDSRGFPTVSCTVVIEQDGHRASGYASVPSGASTGSHEALELRDGGLEFNGKGVKRAVQNVNEQIAKAILRKEFSTAEEIDALVIQLDSTKDKSSLGANATLAVSEAVHRAFANLYGIELWQYLRRLYFSDLPASVKFPRIMCNILNGGAHADNNIDIQEFMLIPNTGNVEKDIRLCSEVYHQLKKNLLAHSQSTGVGDEGGFAPNLGTMPEVLEYVNQAILDAKFSRVDCDLGLDVAASEFYNKETNLYEVDGKELTSSQLVDYYATVASDYNLLSIEDPLAEDDLLGWSVVTEKLGQKVTLVGDDLFVTNTERFNTIAIEQHIANAILIKPNQIGTILETAKVINLAKSQNYKIAVSHRSGETSDSFISDLAFASQADFLKCGAAARGERVAKYNRLLEILDGLVE
jgi:enolase